MGDAAAGPRRCLQVGPGSAGRSAWAHWEHSGASRADASVRKKLTAGDVAQSRLRVPAPLFELLFGRSAKVVLQAAPTNIGHFIAAAAAADRKGYLLQVGARWFGLNLGNKHFARDEAGAAWEGARA